MASAMRLVGRHKHRRPERRRSLWHGWEAAAGLLREINLCHPPALWRVTFSPTWPVWEGLFVGLGGRGGISDTSIL